MKHSEGKVSISSSALVVSEDLKIIANCLSIMEGLSILDMEIIEANAERIASLWNAAEGMSNEEALKYIKHGKEMEEVIKWIAAGNDPCPTECDHEICKALNLLNKLNGGE
jgi:hypothetical protein